MFNSILKIKQTKILYIFVSTFWLFSERVKISTCRCSLYFPQPFCNKDVAPNNNMYLIHKEGRKRVSYGVAWLRMNIIDTMKYLIKESYCGMKQWLAESSMAK